MDLPSDADRIARVSGGPAPHDVRRAIDYMRRNVGRRISMADLIGVCHVSERTLRKHFSTFIGCAPLVFLRRLRLAAVRETLLKGTKDTSVTEVATLYGFTHFGRFSSQYRQAFGEMPSITLGRGRAGSEERSDRTKPIGAGREPQERGLQLSLSRAGRRLWSRPINSSPRGLRRGSRPSCAEFVPLPSWSPRRQGAPCTTIRNGSPRRSGRAIS
jgi:AraC-like DNA-binding protein